MTLREKLLQAIAEARLRTIAGSAGLTEAVVDGEAITRPEDAAEAMLARCDWIEEAVLLLADEVDERCPA
jgi:hypothetical protein